MSLLQLLPHMRKATILKHWSLEMGDMETPSTVLSVEPPGLFEGLYCVVLDTTKSVLLTRINLLSDFLESLWGKLRLWNCGSFSQVKKLHTSQVPFLGLHQSGELSGEFSCPSCVLSLCNQYLYSFNFFHCKYALNFLASKNSFQNALV